MRSKQIEIRYSSEYYTNALYGRYETIEEAKAAYAEALARLFAHGYQRVAASFEIR